MTALADTLPDIELLPGDVPPRAERPVTTPSWRSAPLPDIEPIAPRGVRPAPSGRPRGRRTDWPPPLRPPATRARAAAPRPPRPPMEPRPPIVAAPPPPLPRPEPLVELVIPAFVTPRPPMPRASVAPGHPDPPLAGAPPQSRPERRRSGIRWGRLGSAALIAIGVLALGARAIVPGDPAGTPAPEAIPVAAAAIGEIPPDYLLLYQRFGRAMDIDWRFLAAIGGQESDHGRDLAAARINRDGCIGPMQLGVGGRCGDFVGAWGVDGDGDGRVDPRRPADAIATAARGLRLAKGAPPVGGDAAGYREAACGYYGACSDDRVDYADEVMARAARYGFTG